MPNLAELAMKRERDFARLQLINRLVDETKQMNDADEIKAKLLKEQKELNSPE